MVKPSIGRVLLSLSAVWAGAGAYAFDWNATHIYNPNWPPHAKFHNAQTMSLGTGLGLATLAAIWLPRDPWSRARLDVATTAASLYWATQLSALAYPGTALVDPPRKNANAQVIVASAALTVNAVAYLLERRALVR